MLKFLIVVVVIVVVAAAAVVAVVVGRSILFSVLSVSTRQSNQELPKDD